MMFSNFDNLMIGSCKFNKGIDCMGAVKNCGRCGFNPEVAQDRVERFKQKRGMM